MKNIFKPLLLIPALSAFASAGSFVAALPAGHENIFINLPMRVPGPAMPLGGSRGVNLPGPASGPLGPTMLILAPSAIAAAPATAAAVQTYQAGKPAVVQAIISGAPAAASLNGQLVRGPGSRWISVAPAAGGNDGKNGGDRPGSKPGGALFDGEKGRQRPAPRPVVVPSERFHLPESELERELGLR